MNHESSSTHRRLYPDGLGLIQLYWSPSVVAAALSRCRDAGWKVVEADVSGWHSDDQLHDDFAAALPVPDYYGRNLDAMLDILRSIADGSAGSVPEPGLALVLNNVEELADRDRTRLEVLLDLFSEAAIHGLHHGWPLAILVQSNDADLELGPVRALPVDWNPAERKRLRRT